MPSFEKPLRSLRLIAALCVLALSSLAPSSRLDALDLNGFFPASGTGAVAISQTYESYDQFWVGKTKVAEPGLGEIENESTSLYLTWGLSDDLALVANLAHISSEAQGPAQLEESGLQDLELLIKYRFWSGGNHSLAAAAGGRTPLSDYLADGPVSIGDETTDFLLRMVYQCQHGPLHFSQQVGYDLRGDDAPDGFPLYTEVGYSFGRIDVGAYYYRYMADGGTDIGQAGFTFPSNKDETERFGAKLFGRVTDEIGISLLAFSTLDGRNSGDAEGFSIGLSYGF